MKVVKTKDDKISLGKLVDDPYKYIIVAKVGCCNIYALFNHEYWTWLDIKNNEVLDEFENISIALQSIKIDNLYAFETYKEFSRWLKGN